MLDLFPYCIAFTLKNEGGFYENAVTGECSNYGISLKWLRGIKPEATATDIKAISRGLATHLYRTYFWDSAHLAAITLPTVAARVFDLEVNMGSSQGIRLLQTALKLECDGILGPVTAAACNTSNEAELYAALNEAACSRYDLIHDHQVAEYTPKIGAQAAQSMADKNLEVWLNRLETNPPPCTLFDETIAPA